MTSSEYTQLHDKLEHLTGALYVTQHLLMVVLPALGAAERQAVLSAAARTLEAGYVKSLGSANASEAFLQGIATAARRFSIAL